MYKPTHLIHATGNIAVLATQAKGSKIYARSTLRRVRARGRSNLASPLNALESIKIIGEACRYLERGGWISIVTKRVDPDVYPEKLARWRQGLGMCAQILTTANRDAARFSVPRAHAPFGQAFHVRRYHGVRLHLDLLIMPLCASVQGGRAVAFPFSGTDKWSPTAGAGGRPQPSGVGRC